MKKFVFFLPICLAVFLRGTWDNWSKTVLLIILSISILSELIKSLHVNKIIIINNKKLLLYAFFFLCINIFSAFLSKHQYFSFSKILDYTLMCLFILYFSIGKIEREYDFFLLNLFITFIICFIVIFTDIRNFKISIDYFFGRHISSLLVNPNFLSGFLIMAMPLNIYLLLNIKNNLLFFMNSIFIYILILTHSNLSFISISLSFIFCKITFKSLKFKKYIYLSSISIVLVFLFFFMTPKNIFPVSIQNRIDYWHSGLNMFYKAPLFGHGPGTYEYISYFYNKNVIKHSKYAHNFFLELLSESGIFSFIIILMIFINTYKKVSYLQLKIDDTWKYNRYFFISWFFVAVFFQVNFDFSFSLPSNLFYFFSIISIFTKEKDIGSSTEKQDLILLKLKNGIVFSLFIFLILFLYSKNRTEKFIADRNYAKAEYLIKNEPQNPVIEQLLKKSLYYENKNPGLYYLYAIYYLQRRNYEKALESVNISIKIYPENYRNYFLKGNIYRCLGKNDLANENYKIASKIAPNEKVYKKKID